MLHVPPWAQARRPQEPCPPPPAQWPAAAQPPPAAAPQPQPAPGWGAAAPPVPSPPPPPPPRPPPPPETSAAFGSAMWAWPGHPQHRVGGPAAPAACPQQGQYASGRGALAAATKARGAGSAAAEASSARMAALRALNRRITRATSVELSDWQCCCCDFKQASEFPGATLVATQP